MVLFIDNNYYIIEKCKFLEIFLLDDLTFYGITKRFIRKSRVHISAYLAL